MEKMEKEVADLKAMFTGPSYDDLKDLKTNTGKSLLRVVSGIVYKTLLIGYHVFKPLP